VSNVEVRKRTGLAKLEEITKQRRLGWFGHVIRMEDCRKPGRPRKNWQDIIRTDLRDVGLTWDEPSELALSRYSWRQRVANVSYTQDELRSRVRSFKCVPLFFELKLTF